MKKLWIRAVRDSIIIAAAALIYAAGISLFLDPNNLAPGGVTGIAVILNRLCGIETGTLYSSECAHCPAGYLEIRVALYHKDGIRHCNDLCFYQSAVSV